MTRKLLYAAFMLPVLFSGCTQKDIFSEVDYNVTLDPSNTYVAGEPVTFNFTGNVENILFYSGESGFEYQYRNRYTVPLDQLSAASLELTVSCRYGTVPGGLDIYYSNSFAGLDGSDADADRIMISDMSSDMESAGWKKITVWGGDNPEEPTNSTQTTASVELDIYDALDNFSLAFHWHPTRGENQDQIQRTYYVSGALNIETVDGMSLSRDLSELMFTTFMTNDAFADDPYFTDTNPVTNNNNGAICLNSTSGYDIVFQGAGANIFGYDLDGWCFSVPQSLNSVTNDKGTVIKNMQNYLNTYSYTYEDPGTYQAVFVGRNANYLGSSEEVRTFQVTVLNRPVGSGAE